MRQNILVAVVVVLAIALATVGGILIFGGSEPARMPGTFRILSRDDDLADVVNVKAEATPETGWELNQGTVIASKVHVKWVGENDKGLSDMGYDITFKLVVSRRESEVDLVLLVGKGEFGVQDYVGSLGQGWEMVGSDSHTLSELDNTETFSLTVTWG